MSRNLRNGLLAMAGFLILIFDSKTALEGAVTGIDLCLRTIVPSLFPFFVLSSMLTRAFYGSNLKIIRILSGWFGIPPEAGILFISSILGGYPVGAQSVGNLYKNRILSKEDAETILPICNNSGPAFIFGIVSCLFQEKWIPWTIWLIQIVSTFFTAKWFVCKTKLKDTLSISDYSLTQAVSASTHAIGQVCAWVVLFRIVITFMIRWVLWLFPDTLRIILLGVLELTNGCMEASAIRNSELRFIICSAILSFGGLCVIMQTNAVTPGLSLRKYCCGKTLQAIISLLLSALIIFHKWTMLLALFVILNYLPKLFLKRVEFSEDMIYNACNDLGRILKCSFEKK